MFSVPEENNIHTDSRLPSPWKEPDDSALPPHANRSRSAAFKPPVGEAMLPFDDVMKLAFGGDPKLPLDVIKLPYGGDARLPFDEVMKLPFGGEPMSPCSGGDAMKPPPPPGGGAGGEAKGCPPGPIMYPPPFEEEAAVMNPPPLFGGEAMWG